MTEEESTKKAWSIIEFVTKETPLPFNVIWEKKSDGKILLKFFSTSRIGDSMIISYLPPIKWLRVFLSDFEKFGKTTESKSYSTPFWLTKDLIDAYNNSGNPLPFSNPIQFGEILLINIYSSLLTNLAPEFEETFKRIYELPLLTSGELIAIIDAKRAHPNKENNDSNTFEIRMERNIKKNTEEILRERNRRGSKILTDKLKEIDANRSFLHSQPNLMKYFYDLLLPQWQKAKAFYKKNKDSKRWRDLIKIEFDEILPETLIESLADADPYSSMPSIIARVHAAKFCGYKDSEITENRNLSILVQKSREWASKNPAQEKNLIKKFFNESLLAVQITAHQSQVPNKITRNSFNELTYLQQFIYLHNLNSLENLNAFLANDN